ncbi:uncharacterized protein SOCEGT47_000940 [Sorangium cellulosum]|uniref:Uncharacterized protein n=1 Tax=Sorangium cellulosum TaxID=56 RepID=A0A4V0NCM0_SORCE|nr:uncharacterized protein SOCEGT47_000940 [Sorangium cellulosum]
MPGTPAETTSRKQAPGHMYRPKAFTSCSPPAIKKHYEGRVGHRPRRA